MKKRKEKFSEYLSLVNGDLPPRKRFTRKQYVFLREFFNGRRRNVGISGSRCSGRSTLLSFAAIMTALHNDGDVIFITSNYQYMKYSAFPTVHGWLPTFGINPESCKVLYHPYPSIILPNERKIIFMTEDQLDDKYKIPSLRHINQLKLVVLEDADQMSSDSIVHAFQGFRACTRIIANYFRHGLDELSISTIRHFCKKNYRFTLMDLPDRLLPKARVYKKYLRQQEMKYRRMKIKRRHVCEGRFINHLGFRTFLCKRIMKFCPQPFDPRCPHLKKGKPYDHRPSQH